MNLTEKIKSFVSPRRETSPMEAPLDFVKTRKGILRELAISKQAGTLIGVYCKTLGEGMFLTGVEGLEATMDGEIITFKPYDLSGRILQRARVELTEIQMVCPFNKPYRNPVVVNGKAKKTNAFL